MSDDTVINVVSIQETEYGKKAVLDSPYEAKDAISLLPWQAYSEEIEEHGSMLQKAKDRGEDVRSSDVMDVIEAMEDFDFSDDFATHNTWDPDALDGDGAWLIDADAVPEATEFWESMGYTVENDAQITA